MSLANRLILSLPPETPLIVAVSGGADSIALLHLLRPRFDRLQVVTIDHGLRGLAGAEDAEFVRTTAERWGLSVTVGTLQLDPTAPRLETRARLARYAFLAQTARAYGIAHIATAHHANDQAETILMHLIRGSGLHGLGGMKPIAPVPDHPDLRLVRPLLAIPRAEIEAYCADHDLVYRHDATNDQPHTLRNRIRLSLIPQLTDLNPRIIPTLARTAEVIALEDDWMQSAFHAAIDGQVQRTSHTIRLPLTTYHALHPALKRRFIVWAAQQFGATRLDHADVTRAIMQLDDGAGVNRIVLLTEGLRARVEYDTLLIVTTPESRPTERLVPIPLQIGQNELMPDRSVILSRDPLPDALTITAPIDAVITLRTRQTGDRLLWRGYGRKLTDWMIDHKIARDQRDQLPLIAVGQVVKALYLPSGWIAADPVEGEVRWYLRFIGMP